MISRFRKSLLVLLTVCLMFLMGAAASAETNMISTAKSNTVSNGSFVTTSKGIRFKTKKGTYIKNKWVQIKGKVYSFNNSGYARTGWFTYKNNRYFATKKGVVYHGQWHKSGSHTWYLRKNGVKAAACWIKLKGKYYRFNNWGYLLKGKMFKVGSKWYYVDQNGARVAGKWVTVKEDGQSYRCYFNAKGVRTKMEKVSATAASVSAEDTESASTAASAATSGKLLFVGDSRTVGLSMSVSDGNVDFIGKVGEGYNWLISYADASVRRFLKSNPNATVIFGFGVNDLGNINSYIAYFQKLKTAFPKAEFYFLSVNPVVDGASQWVTNATIKTFNKALKSALGSSYIDTNTYLTKKGFDTFDGIHYTVPTYQKLFSYVKTAIQ